jgi:SAM-dependent methyltransferase/uncharacterized protein YbaR (Trm112 family)
MPQANAVNDQLLKVLVCPREHLNLRIESDELVCPVGHRYPTVDGIPIMLLAEAKPTHQVATLSLHNASSRRQISSGLNRSNGVDVFVQKEIGATNGLAYRSLIGSLTEYPIPELRLPHGEGGYFLDVGCNWGRWSIAAAQKGYRPIGIDPNLEAILAAGRVSRQVGVDASYVVGDARHLPFANQTFSVVFSYSVLQHFAKDDVQRSLNQIRRVLRPDGKSMVQMPSMFGARCLYHQFRRGFREPRDFEVRYWRVSELRSTFSRLIGPSTVTADGYFSLNPQAAEAHLLPRRYRLVVHASDFVRRLSGRIHVLTYLADSLYVTSTKASLPTT